MPRVAPPPSASRAQGQRRRRAGGVGPLPPAPTRDRAAHGHGRVARASRKHVARPLGVSPNVPYEPRSLYRHKKGNFVLRVVEYFEEHPEVPNLYAAALAVYSAFMIRDPKAPPPQDVVDEPGALHVGVVGDYGAGTRAQARIAQQLINRKTALLITTGDNVYPSGREADYRKNWDPTYGAVQKQMPIMPSVGNHDTYRDDLRPYFSRFPHLKGSPYYSYVVQDARFVALDSDQDLRPGSAQHRWLEKQLQEGQQQKWRVVYLHYPLYSTDSNDFVELRKSLQPLFARYKVQIALAGHIHSYERSVPINGTTHITTGGGGQIVYPFSKPRPDFIAHRAPVHHFVILSLGATQAVVRAIDEDGRLVDVAVIPVSGARQAAQGAALVQPGSGNTHVVAEAARRR